MKIALFDVYNRIPISSGGDWWMFQLLSDLARNNSVSMFYTSEKNDVEGYEPKKINFEVHRLPSRINWSGLSTWLDIIRPDALWDRVSLRAIEADCVFTLVYGYHIAAYVARKNNAPVVLVMQNVESQYIRNISSFLHLPIRILENWILSRVDAVITISPEDSHYAAKHALFRVFCIPPQPDADVFSADGARYNYGADFFNIVFYGSLDRYQNRDALAFITKELVPALERERPNAAFKVHVFGSGKAPDYLLSETRIDFIGPVTDPGPYIRGADAVIIPIKIAAGTKLRVVESLACGKPVVATPEAVQGLPEDLREMTYLARTTDEFVGVLKGIREGKLINKTNSSLVLHHMQQDTVDDVLNYVATNVSRKSVASK